MKQEYFTNDRLAWSPTKRQYGDALLEALIGVLLTAVIGLGLSFAASRVLLEQRNQITQNTIIAQVNKVMASTGIPQLCAAGTAIPVTVQNVSLTLSAPVCTTDAVSVAVTGGGAALGVNLPAGVVTAMTFSTPPDSEEFKKLLGGNGVLTISQ
ncbi:MAG: hypothetical protein H7327_08940 [Herminiimonas sp.]|nr:hypothetical protein [Herminiimonas sp.]